MGCAASMVIEHLLKWIRTARVSERAAAASALARVFSESELSFEDRCAAEAALTLLLDDPSSRVRASIAEALSMSRHAPLQIVSALACDQPDVAGMILARSPLMDDSDLIARVADGVPEIQRLIAGRPCVSQPLAAAIAELSDVPACCALLRNTGARIAAISFRRMIERHGENGELRDALLARKELPADCRHMIVVRVGEALRTSPLMLRAVGPARAQRITRDACVRASLSLVDSTRSDEHAALVEHLRLAGELTTAFVVRIVSHGKIDFFGAALISLSGQKEERVRALLANGRDVAVSALLRAGGLPDSVHRILLTALKVWREVANGKRLAGAQEVTWLMIKELGGRSAEGDLANLLKSIHIEALRENARSHAMAIAAA